MRAHALLVLLLAAAGTCQAQTTRYVTDSLRLEARSGPSLDNRILRMLESGTRVEVLEERDGWSRIELDGDEAWILSRFLMDQPAARARLEAAVAARDEALSRAASLREELERSVDTIAALEEERDALAERLEAVAAELAELQRTAASSVALAEENERLQAQTSAMQIDLQSLREDLLLAQRRREREWFLAGAGVLLGGMVLGLVIPKIRWKRRRGWGEL